MKRQGAPRASINWLLVAFVGGAAWLLVGGLVLSVYLNARLAHGVKATVSRPQVHSVAANAAAAVEKTTPNNVQTSKVEPPPTAEKKPVAPAAPTVPAPQPVSSTALALSEPVAKVPELPPSELTAGEERVDFDNYGTKVSFMDNPHSAARLALKEKKLLFVLHLSGNFEDDKFT